MSVRIEDFNRAFHERAIDVTCLSTNNRRISHMHIGGIVIECLIKYLIVKYYGIIDRDGIHNWLARKNYSTMGSNIIKNPKHNLVEGLKRLDILFDQIDFNIKQLIDVLQRPAGIDYIDLRYDCSSISDHDYDEWKKAYLAIRKWLTRNIKYL